MKKSDLKKILKPLVKECMQEALLEEGLLSNIISEVVKGLNTQPLVEQKQPKKAPNIENTLIDEEVGRRRTKINDTRKKMLDAIGNSSYNGVDLFEGTIPMAQTSEPANPLANTDPSDSGIDISNLMGNKRVWNALLEGKK